MLSGGKMKTDIFRVAKNTGLTAYEIRSGLSGSGIATTNANKAFSLIEYVGTKPQFQDDGTVKISFDNYQDDEDIFTFLDTINPPTATASSVLKEVVLENGVKKGGTTTGSDLVLLINYGADNEAGTKEKVLVALGTISKTSGSYNQVYEDYSKPTFEFVGVKAEFDVTIAAALFSSGVGKELDATEVATQIPKIPQYAGFVRKFVLKYGAV